jgi:Protein of unknown function (DUF3151)
MLVSPMPSDGSRLGRVIEDRPSRPLREVPLAAAPPPPPEPGGEPPRHETVLPDEPAEADAAVAGALRADDPGSALRAVLRRWPAHLDGWARLGQVELRRGDTIAAYACARTGYHRGLDRLRRHGWAGVGLVRWSQPGNRAFLRALQLLLVTAAAIDEVDESERCRRFLLDLDPDDGLGAAAYPEAPGAGWEPPPLA